MVQLSGQVTHGRSGHSELSLAAMGKAVGTKGRRECEMGEGEGIEKEERSGIW